MLLVYTHKISPRLRFTFKHICTRILGIDVNFTSKVEEFIAHDSIKMSYTKQPLANELFIKSHDLMYSHGVEDIEIHVQEWEDTKCFFKVSERSILPYDFIAASFYLLSRYEEYLPHVKDNFGRFLATNSLAYKHGFLEQPVIDIWAYKFKKALQDNYPNYKFPNKNYTIQPVIDVPTAFLYKGKNIIRTFGGAFKDIVKLKFRMAYERFAVIFGFINDPYNVYKYIINRQKTTSSKFIFFFLVGDYSTFDKNISITNKSLVSIIKQATDYSRVGLKASFFALDDFSTLKKEKKRIEAIINFDLKLSRHSFSKLNLPDSYRNLLELEIAEDFTMGYVNHPGFRSGTCTPFFYYDLEYEMQTPLKINTYHVMDSALLRHKSLLDKSQALKKLIQTVKSVNGTFTPIFHNYAFSKDPKWEGYKDLFNIVLNSVDEA